MRPSARCGRHWILLVGLTTLTGASGCGPAAPRALLDWSTPVQPSPAPIHTPPPISVEGADLSNGARFVRLRGLNVCSLEFDALGTTWALSPTGSALLSTLADPSRWNVNAVRVPVNQQWFLEDEGYAARLELLIDDAARRDVYVLLDVQWERGETTQPYTANILEVPTFGAGNTTEAFWLAASSRWANRTNLLYDLINEPHDRPEQESAQALQALISAIRSRTQAPIILVGGPDWAHSAEPYQRRPLEGANLVYAVHQYLPYDPPAAFQRQWAAAAVTLPIIISEFLAEPAHADYASQLVDLAEASGVDGWLPWAIGCGLTPDDDTGAEPGRALAAKLRALN